MDDHYNKYRAYREFPQVFKNCFDFSIGLGWDEIVYNLTKDIIEIFPEIQVVQVKEKFGGLRYYYDTATKEVYNKVNELISEAEKLAYRTCEFCGKPGHMTNYGWMLTLCDECEQKEIDRKLKDKVKTLEYINNKKEELKNDKKV
jgi:hypothetical protein